MIYIKRILILTCFALALFSEPQLQAQENSAPSTKKERNHITKGNKLYEEGKFKEAMAQYQAALDENPSSVVGKYNFF